MHDDVTQLTPDEIRAIIAERDALRRFKEFVHARLDVACVPTHPDGPHSKAGCRVGDRLDIGLAPYEAQTLGGGAEGKYGIITASKKAFHEDEPVFLIRATDRNAFVAVMNYVSVCAIDGCSADHVGDGVKHAFRIKHWQRKNASLVKMPD